MTRIKDELVSEAILLLDKEIRSGNIKVNGSVIMQTDKNKENDQSMFIINNLIKQREDIYANYKVYMSEPMDRYDPNTVQRIESLKKFLMSVDAIYILIDYVNTIDGWLKDISMEVGSQDLSDILKRTSQSNKRRIELLDFIAKKGRYLDDHIITGEEARAMRDAIRLQSLTP